MLLNNQKVLFTSSILNLIGNNNTEYFKILLSETKRITTIIKSEIQIVILFLYPLLDYNPFTQEELINHIDSFLMGGEKDSQGIDTLIKKSTSTSADSTLLDFISQAQDEISNKGSLFFGAINKTNDALSLVSKIRFLAGFL